MSFVKKKKNSGSEKKGQEGEMPFRKTQERILTSGGGGKKRGVYNNNHPTLGKKGGNWSRSF